jgi:hypothetical protein
MDADDDVLPPDAERDEHGVPVRPREPLGRSAQCCSPSSASPARAYRWRCWISTWGHSHLRPELRPEAIGAGLVIIIPWVLMWRFTTLKDGLHGAWRLVAIILAGCALAAVILLYSGAAGSICHHNCAVGGGN